MNHIRVSVAEKRAKAASEAARTERQRVAAASKVFMEYHENSSWAAHKLQSGTAPLTPESVEFMQQELENRKVRAARVKALDAELAKEKPDAKQ